MQNTGVLVKTRVLGPTGSWEPVRLEPGYSGKVADLIRKTRSFMP